MKPNGKQDTKPDVHPDGKQDTTIETSKVEITVSGDKKAEASVTITKDAQGNVTSANATVSGSKGTLTADVVKQLTEAAGTEDLTLLRQNGGKSAKPAGFQHRLVPVSAVRTQKSLDNQTVGGRH